VRRTALLLALCIFPAFLPLTARAQNTSIEGQILKSDGTPWPNLEVDLTNAETGDHYKLTTDNAGRYSQWGLRPGTYRISLVDAHDSSFSYSETHVLHGPAENEVSINFSKNSGVGRGHSGTPDEEDAARFAAMKAHFNAGTGAIQDAETLRSQLATAPSDRKTELQQKVAADRQSAIEQFRLAEQADSQMDARTHAMILSHLADAYDIAGRDDDAVGSYEKALALSPEATAYQNLAKLQARRAVRLADSPPIHLDWSSARASCSAAAALKPGVGATCWKNLGIILGNARNFPAAEIAWRESTTLAPNDPQAWLQLGQTLVNLVQYQPQGTRVVAVFPADTADALQKCIAADPNGPFAESAKQLLAELGSNKSSN
jgi:Flp pilus assembly protein TadD